MQMRTNALVIAIAIVLSGCAALTAPSSGIQESVDASQSAKGRLQSIKAAGPISRHEGPKLAGTEIQVIPEETVPSAFIAQFGYQSIPQTFTSLLSDLSRRTGLTIRLQPGLRESASGQGGATGEKKVAVTWNGTLRGLFDHLADKTNLAWRFESGAVEFFRTDTRTFTVYIPAGKKTMSSSIQLSGGQGESGSKSDSLVNVSAESSIDPYAAILSSVELIVRDGGKEESSKSVVANPALGSITVTASPAILDKVARYIKANNEKFAQNVLIGIKVYNITLKRGANAGASANLQYENIGRNLGLEMIAPVALAPATGSAATGSLMMLSGSRFAGSSVLIQALESLGDVSLVTSGDVVTANGQPAPLQVAKEIVYLASSTSTPFSSGSSTGVTTTLVPGTKTVGFTANFIPLILSDNRLLLQYQINLSSLLELGQASSGGSSIQTPATAMQSLQQQAYMRDGQKLVLFGFEQQRLNAEKRKSFLGFSWNSDSDRTVMVIVMEAYLGK